jgi:hypothetical protein
MNGLHIERSADPTFMRQMLEEWISFVERYDYFHRPPKGHEDFERGIIWDAFGCHNERTQVSALVTGAISAGGIGAVEYTTEGIRDDGSKTWRHGDFYLCSRGYVVFEGEAKKKVIQDTASLENGVIEEVVSGLNACDLQFRRQTKKNYAHTPTAICFVLLETKDSAQRADKLIDDLLNTIRSWDLKNSESPTAWAWVTHEPYLPVEWAKDRKLYYPGIFVFVREEDKPRGPQ